MTAIGDVFGQLQERQTEAMKQYQDAVTQAMKSWQETLTPSGDSGAGAATLFDPAKLAENYFSFASDLLNRQHEFTMKLVEMMKPATGS